MPSVSLAASIARGLWPVSKSLKHHVHISNDLPALIRTELGCIRWHLSCSKSDDVKNPPGRKLDQTIRKIRRRRRDLAGDRSIALALLAVTDETVGLKQRFTLLQCLRRCTIWILQLASGAGRLLFTGAIVKRMKTSRDGSSNRSLERESIPRYGVWCICFVSWAAGHVRPVF